MVRSETGAAGVMFSLDTESGFDKVVFVTSAWGLGETVVGGTVNPDEWYVFKPTLAEGKTAIVSRTMGSKKCKMVYIKGGGTELVDTKPEEQDNWSLVDQQVEDLAVMAVKIEKHYGRPMDIEWARDGDDGKLYIVQARPETVASQKKVGVIEDYKMLDKGKNIKAEGRAVGNRIGAGKVNILTSIDQMSQFQAGEILVADMTDPDWEPIMKKADSPSIRLFLWPSLIDIQSLPKHISESSYHLLLACFAAQRLASLVQLTAWWKPQWLPFCFAMQLTLVEARDLGAMTASCFLSNGTRHTVAVTLSGS